MIFWAALLSMHNTCFSLSCWWCTVLWSQGWFMIHVYSCIQSRFFKVSICPFTSACALPLLIRLTDVAYFQGKDGAGLFLRLGVATGMKQLLKEHVVIAGLKASTEMFLCQGSSSDWFCSLPALIFPLGTPSFIKSPEDQTGISGGVASFVCQAVGEPKPRITWMKKGKKVSSQRFEVRRVSSLSEVFECATPPCLTPSLLITCLHLCDTEQQVTRCHFIEHMQHAAQEDVCAFSRRGQTADWWCIYSLLPCTKNQTQQLSPFSACLKTT